MPCYLIMTKNVKEDTLCLSSLLSAIEWSVLNADCFGKMTNGGGVGEAERCRRLTKTLGVEVRCTEVSLYVHS